MSDTTDGRDPLEPTNVYIRRLVTERNEARAQVAGVEALAVKWDGQADKYRTSEPVWAEARTVLAHSLRAAIAGKPEPKPCHCGGEHHA